MLKGCRIEAFGVTHRELMKALTQLLEPPQQCINDVLFINVLIWLYYSFHHSPSKLIFSFTVLQSFSFAVILNDFVFFLSCCIRCLKGSEWWNGIQERWGKVFFFAFDIFPRFLCVCRSELLDGGSLHTATLNGMWSLPATSNSSATEWRDRWEDGDQPVRTVS